MAAWPGTLPALVTQAGYGESVPDQLLETPTDAGPGKARRKSTGMARPIKCSIRCTAAQVATFETFYLSTLAGGTLEFTWVHPRTQVAKSLRFRKPVPAYNPLGAGNVQIDMNLWVL
jgi:hypothetical protein